MDAAVFLPGADKVQYYMPLHLAVDSGGSVFVADWGNQRVTLLSSALVYQRHVATSDQLKWNPCLLFFDKQRRVLYIADNEWKDMGDNDPPPTGRVVIIDL